MTGAPIIVAGGVLASGCSDAHTVGMTDAAEVRAFFSMQPSDDGTGVMGWPTIEMDESARVAD